MMTKEIRPRKKTAVPPWKMFENAVAKFVAALDPSATVTPNTRLPDLHTNRRRQRDVWIDAKVCNHYPISVLVSCKRYGRTLDEQDIDHFNGELLSTKARLGVIYSYSGFNEAAIEKSKVLGISCCGLYQGHASLLPSVLHLKPYYCLCATAKLAVDKHRQWGLTAWADLFNLKIDAPNEPSTMLDVIVNEFDAGLHEEIKRYTGPPASAAQDWVRQFTFSGGDDKPGLTVTIFGIWKVHRSKSDAVLIDGSYNFTSDEFSGTHATPAIRMKGGTPGPEWELLQERPENLDDSMMVITFWPNADQFRQATVENLASMPIGGDHS
jgi:Restriction endonuclease